MKNKNYEEIECFFCKKKFKRSPKNRSKSKPLALGIRPAHSIHCSKECTIKGRDLRVKLIRKKK